MAYRNFYRVVVSNEFLGVSKEISAPTRYELDTKVENQKRIWNERVKREITRQNKEEMQRKAEQLTKSDNKKIEEYKKDTYYKNVAVVNQESFLFNMSIKDNLKMACKDEKKQIEICKKVGIHELIQSMPKGYDTILTENAANLSGGQKRLLSLAKTLLTDSKILLFDEVTSSLDIKTTNKIISILKELKDSHTVIIITHKKEVMKISDEIILLSKGRIVGKGTYKNLLKNNHFDKLVKN